MSPTHPNTHADRQARERALLAIATPQEGYFTAAQARAAGYSYSAQRYHTRKGDWRRMERGVYYLSDYDSPIFPRHDLIILSLMSMDRHGEPQAVVSHETALAWHGLSDVNPMRIHVTLPPKSRKRAPDGIIVHRGVVKGDEYEVHEGYRITTPLRTLNDVTESPGVWPHLADAVRDALRMGLVTPRQIIDSPEIQSRREWLSALLERLEALSVCGQRLGEDVGAVAHQAVHAPIEQTIHRRAVVDGPDVNVQAEVVRRRDTARRDDANAAIHLRDLQRVIWRA